VNIQCGVLGYVKKQTNYDANFGLDDKVEKTVDDRIGTFMRSLDPNITNTKQFQTSLVISFLERRAKKYWFSNAQEEVCWEVCHHF
jgi:hypothetical protein